MVFYENAMFRGEQEGPGRCQDSSSLIDFAPIGRKEANERPNYRKTEMISNKLELLFVFCWIFFTGGKHRRNPQEKDCREVENYLKSTFGDPSPAKIQEKKLKDDKNKNDMFSY